MSNGLYQTVKPIPTTVHGVTTRSRLEARWILFFEHARIPWEYEPEAYRIGTRGYLPDFRIRPHRGADQAWMEIKPVADTFDDPRWAGLVTGTGLMLFTVRDMHRRGDVCGRDHTVRVWHPSGMVADVHRMWTGPEFRTAWEAAHAARFDGRRPAVRKGRRE
jgi:hypothetical protein